MKDNELRNMFASIERKIGDRPTGVENAHLDEQHLFERLDRIEHKIGQHIGGEPASDADVRDYLDRIEKAIESKLPIPIRYPKDWLDRLERIEMKLNTLVDHAVTPRPLMLPSPRVPMIVGMVIGAMLFTAGMLAGYLLK